jgi:dTDP-L-rhamnose 4-epimerase
VKILVTGGAGFIGSHVVDLLVARGHQVRVLDNLDPQVHGPGAAEPRHILGHVRAQAVEFRRGDVTDSAAMQDALEGVESVIHLAATVGVGQSMYEPLYYVHTNATGTGLLLDRIAKNARPMRKLVVASSMSLYGEGAFRCAACGGEAAGERTRERLEGGRWEVPCAGCGADMQPLPTPETKAADIASVYAATKKHQEDLVVSFGRAWRIPSFALRFFNVYGARQSLRNPYTGVAAIFLSRYLSDRPPLIFEDGGQSRDFIDVRDVADAIVRAAEFEGAGQYVLNIGTGRPTRVSELAKSLAHGLGVSIGPQYLGKYRAGDIRHCFSDASRAREVLGFEARFALEGGLPDLITWCRGEQVQDEVERSLKELADRRLVQ